MAFTAAYVKYELPLYTKVTEEDELIDLGTITLEVPVVPEAGRLVVQPNGAAQALCDALGVAFDDGTEQ